MAENKNLYILTVDAKDLYLSNHFYESNLLGYNIRDSKGDIYLKKYINTFDYSLEQIKLRAVHEKIYRNNRFSFSQEGKQYTQYVINVTFKYSIKNYNQQGNYYIKFPYDFSTLKFKDGVCIINGELIGIQVFKPSTKSFKYKNSEIIKPISKELLGEHFYYSEGYYRSKENFKTLFSTEELRYDLYKNGFICDGIEYRRFKRSSGSARVGKCLFIDKKLYPQIHKWELCGLKLTNRSKVDLASFESYISLTCSSIIDTINIYPENILIIDDHKSVFNERCVAVSFDSKKLVSEEKEVEISNSIWDGQSLMDISLYGEYENYCMLLLRNRFFKSACFSTNIQQFFKDKGITEISQLNGYTQAEKIEDIKLITTPSSIKYLKFGSQEEWLNNLESLFGIVKHEKPTHFFGGRLVSTHYQLLNTLHLTEKETEEFLNPTLKYLDYLRNDMDIVKYHIKYGFEMGFEYKGAKSKNDIIYKMLSINSDFSKTKLYYDFKIDLLKSFIKSIRTGHILVNGNYSTLLGNPYEMLLHSINQFNGDTVFKKNTIHSTNFQNNEEILGSRSPHVTLGNILLVKNSPIKEIEEYFNLTDEICCVNSIEENILERLSGADFDSDTMMLTNNSILINSAKKYYNNFLVPTRLIESIKRPRRYTSEDQADLDIKTSVNKIGEIINLSQDLNSLIWDNINNGASIESVQGIYRDVAVLDVMSNLEIDMAKKEFAVDNAKELKRIRLKYKILDKQLRQVKSNFFSYVDRIKGFYDNKTKFYKFHDTTMDYVQRVMNRQRRRGGKRRDFIPFSNIFNINLLDRTKIVYEQANRIFSLVQDCRKQTIAIWDNKELSQYEKSIISSEIKQSCIDYIDKIEMNSHTMLYLLESIEREEYKKIRKFLFNTLFGSPNKSFYDFLYKNQESMYEVVEVVKGDLDFYGLNFTKNLQKRAF